MIKHKIFQLILTLTLLLRSCDMVHASLIQAYINYIDGVSVTGTNLEGNLNNIRNVVNGDLDNNNAAVHRGFRFYEVLGTLPVAGTIGRIVFLNSNKILYYDDGSQFLPFIAIAGNPSAGDIIFFDGSVWVKNGGTHAQGDTLYYTGTSWTQLAKSTTATNYVTNMGTNNNPTWDKVQTMNGLFMPNQVQGDVFYASTPSVVNRLAPGTSGQFLQTQGTSANPRWWSSEGKFVSATTVSGAISSGTISISNTKIYRIVVIAHTFTGDIKLILRFNSDSGNHYVNSDASSISEVTLSGTIEGSSSANDFAIIEATIWPQFNSTHNTVATSRSDIFNSAGAVVSANKAAYWDNNAAATSFVILTSDGVQSFTGTIYLYELSVN